MSRNYNEIDRLKAELENLERANSHLQELNEFNKNTIDELRNKTYTKLEEESPVIKKGKKDLKIKKNEVEIYEEELKDFVKKIDVSQDSVNELNKALDKLYDN